MNSDELGAELDRLWGEDSPNYKWVKLLLQFGAPGEPKLCLDGTFTMAELETLVRLLKWYKP